jgi:adenylate cyclase
MAPARDAGSGPIVPADPWQPLAEALLGTPALTPPEVAREAGVEPALTRQLWRALGFPPVEDDERVFTHADVEIVRAVRALIELGEANPDDVLQLTRVIGQSLARVAEAQVNAGAERLERMRLETPSRETAVGDLVGRVEMLTPRLEQFLGYVWRRHLLAALRRRSVTPTLTDRTLTIGFADLVDFTALSRVLAPRELAETVNRFEGTAYEHIVGRGGRVVKMIGDEVMFAVDAGGVAGDVAIALVEAHGRDAGQPDVRVGLASGPVLSWEGDLYGPTVNLASRLVNLARPGTVLVSEELGAELTDDPRFALRQLRAVKLQGIGRARPWVLRRARV